MRVVIFGSRTYGVVPTSRYADSSLIARRTAQLDYFYETMNNFLASNHISTIISGGAAGADDHAINFAKKNGIELEVYMAEWHRYGRIAGPMRNKEMIVRGKPNLAIGFIDRINKLEPMSPGSENMYQQCKKAFIPVELMS